MVKLNKKNYKTWSFNIKLELEERGLWDLVNSDDSLEEVTEEQKKRAFRIIARSIVEEIQEDILDLTCPRTLWKRLEARFQPNTRLRRLQASKSFFTAKMSDEEDMETYVNRVFALASDVEKAGSDKISNEQICNILINGLSDEYDTTVAMICTFRDEEYNTTTLESLLVGEFKRKMEKEIITSTRRNIYETT